MLDKKNRFRMRSGKVLSKCIENAIAEFKFRTFQKFHCKPNGGTKLLAHFMIAP